MSIQSRKNKRRSTRAFRVREKIRAVSAGVRVSVFRSLSNFYAQVIDDLQSKTLASCSTVELSNLSGDKKQQAHAVGLELAKKIKALDLKSISFDRGSFLYHGRVQAFADGLREGGINI